MKEKAAGRPREYEPEAVLESALCAFWRNGYEGTSVQVLTDVTGLSRSSLYAAWGEKRDLFVAALKSYIACQGEQLRAALSAPGSRRDAIAQVLNRMIAPPGDNPPGCFVVNTITALAGRDPEIAALVEGNLRSNEAAFRAALEEARESGEIAPDKDIAALACHFVNALHGLGVTAQATQDQATRERIVRVTLSVLD